MCVPKEERALIDALERRLAEKYSALPMDHVTAVVRHAYSQFQSSRVREFIPLLVQRRADGELEELSGLRPGMAAGPAGSCARRYGCARSRDHRSGLVIPAARADDEIFLAGSHDWRLRLNGFGLIN